MQHRTNCRLGNLQLQIMRVLWQRGSATVAEVREDLNGQALAYTTIATMLRKMEARGLVDHHSLDRRFVYRALVSEDDVTRTMADDLVDRLFGGSLSAAVSHLLKTRDVSPPELADLERLVQRHKTRR